MSFRESALILSADSSYSRVGKKIQDPDLFYFVLDYAVPLEHNSDIMNALTTQKRAQIISALVEGNSLRATSRMTGASKVTILRLLESLGAACAAYQDKILRNLTCKRIQCDEIWQFCYAKEKNVPADKQGQFGYGNVWTWVAMDAGTKLVPSWLLGGPDAGTAHEFVEDLALRLADLSRQRNSPELPLEFCIGGTANVSWREVPALWEADIPR
jgi:hypothetical protein